MTSTSPDDGRGSNGGVAALNLQNLGITSLDGMPPWQMVEILNLRDNHLVNLYGIPTITNLKFLHLDNNQITSFLGMSHQPNIEILTIENNPICLHPHFRIMALLACGETLKIINYRTVTDEERRYSALLGGSGSWAARAVSLGWTDLQLKVLPEEFYKVLTSHLRDEYPKVVAMIDQSNTIQTVLVRQGLVRPPPSVAELAEAEARRQVQRNTTTHTASPFTPRQRMNATVDPDRLNDHFGYGVDREDDETAGFHSAVRAGAPYLRREPDGDDETTHRGPVAGQLTLKAFNDFYRATGVPHDFQHRDADAAQRGLERVQVQQMPHALMNQRHFRGEHLSANSATVMTAAQAQHELRTLVPQDPTIQWGTPTSYGVTAVDAARAYKEHFKRTGSLAGAPQVPLPNLASQRSADEKVAEALVATPSPSSSAHDLDPALLLLQSEIGCLSSVIIDSVDVRIVASGNTTIPNAVCKVSSSSGCLYVFEGQRIVFAADLCACRDIELDRIEGSVRVIGATNVHVDEGEDGSARITQQPQQQQRKATVHIIVRSARVGNSEPRQSSDSNQRALLAKGIFKLLMLFKCSPSELSSFYSKVVVTEAKQLHNR